MKEMIAKRKSCRKYTDAPLSDAILESIRSFQMEPLYPDIQVRWHVVEKEHIRSPFAFTTEQLVVIFSENKPGYLENVGFMFQQMDLWLQKQGLGVCWLGMGKPKDETKALEPDLDFVIMLTVGYPDEEIQRKDLSEFIREPLEKISDQADARLEPVRLAPSSCNTQPWYFVHDGDVMHVYWDQKAILRKAILGYFNQIDMGIGLAHLYVTNPETFRFFRVDGVATIRGFQYIGSITF